VSTDSSVMYARPLTRVWHPPRSQAFRGYKLVDESGQSSEKTLRTLLAFCPEWASEQCRKQLADAITAGTTPGSPSLAQLLRVKDCSAVRKDHMLYMCLAWRYKSGLWYASQPALQGGRLPLPPPL